MKWFFGRERGNEAVVKDLKSLVSGRVLADEISRIAYSVSPFRYPVKPLAIVQPKDKMDVVKAVKYAGSRGFSITPRGSGSSLSGNSVGEGILLDFSPWMNQILEFNPDEKTVWVQPGLLLSSLNGFLHPHGLFFPIDPTSGGYCTLGGMIGNNTIGSHSAKYGSTGDHVQDLEVVLSNGEVIPTGPLSLRGREMRELLGAQTLEGEVYRTLPDLLKRYGKALKSEKPSVLRNSAGYNLWGIKKGQSLNLTPLFVGSEGTLGIITEAKLNLTALPGKPLFVLLGLEDIDQLGPAAEELIGLGASRVEMLHRSMLDLSRKLRSDLEPRLFEGMEALLVVEFEGSQSEEVKEGLSRLSRGLGSRFKPRVIEAGEEGSVIEKIKKVPIMVSRDLKGSMRAVTVVDGVAVDPSRLSPCLRGLREAFHREGVTPIIDGNAGDGTLRIRAQFDRASDDDAKRLTFLEEACYEVILGFKGTITLRHGDGRWKTPYLKRQYPSLYSAMEEVKTLFDPRNIFNPNCIVGKDGLQRGTKYGFLFHGAGGGKVLLADAVLRQGIENCTGCGSCRAFCPIARTLHEEWATPRAKAAVWREVLSRGFDSKGNDRHSWIRVMEHCLDCKRCLIECPVQVDGARIANEGRFRFPGRFRSFFPVSKPFGKLGDILYTLGRRMAPRSWGRTVLEKMIRLDRRRLLPGSKGLRLTPTGRQRSLTGRERSVVYVSTGYGCIPGRAGDDKATLDVLERNGFDVIILERGDHPWPKGCEASSRSMGRALTKTLENLASFAEEGLKIVFSDPRVGSMIQSVSSEIFDSQRARFVAAQCFEVHQFLMLLYDRRDLCLELGAVDKAVAYHHPCHLNALGILGEPLALLRLIPGLEVHVLRGQCCGMGGGFGMTRDYFDLSMTIGEPLFREIKERNLEEVVTSCGACRLQIYQGTGKKTAHPISLLADAYRRGKDKGEREKGERKDVPCPDGQPR